MKLKTIIFKTIFIHSLMVFRNGICFLKSNDLSLTQFQRKIDQIRNRKLSVSLFVELMVQKQNFTKFRPNST